MYQTLDDLENNHNNLETPNKRKLLKWSLIFLGILLSFGGVWAGLTKTGVIPNWFGFEALCPNTNFDTLSVGNNEELIKGDDDDLLWQLTQPTHDDTLSVGNNEKLIEGDNNSLLDRLWQLTPPEYDTFIPVEKKPIIYIYPTTETEINVKLGTPQNISHTYPKYNSEKGRNVIAQPNGDLEDMDTGRKLYALYREGKSNNETNFDEGFVVAGKDIIPFLEEKLAILGLNEREAEEFIVYRLPQMEDNEYNLIRFETKAEQDENMPLNITPKPDTVIRVMMDWKAIEEPMEIPEQQLTTPERNGFTVVEWGGSPRN